MSVSDGSEVNNDLIGERQYSCLQVFHAHVSVGHSSLIANSCIVTDDCSSLVLPRASFSSYSSIA